MNEKIMLQLNKYTSKYYFLEKMTISHLWEILFAEYLNTIIVFIVQRLNRLFINKTRVVQYIKRLCACVCVYKQCTQCLEYSISLYIINTTISLIIRTDI